MGGHGVLECFDNFITTTWQFPYLLNKNSKMWKWTIDYKIVKNRFDISWTHALCLSVWSKSWKLKLPGIFQPFINEILSVFLLICPCKSHKIKCALIVNSIDASNNFLFSSSHHDFPTDFPFARWFASTTAFYLHKLYKLLHKLCSMYAFQRVIIKYLRATQPAHSLPSIEYLWGQLSVY